MPRCRLWIHDALAYYRIIYSLRKMYAMSPVIQKLRFRPVIYGAEERQPTHTHDELHLSIVVRGGIRETVGRKTALMGPLTVVSKDPGLQHADEYGSGGATMAQLSLPATSLRMLTDGDSRVSEWHVSSRADVARPYLRLIRRAAGAACEFDVNDADVIDLLAGLSARQRTNSRRPPAWLEQQIDRIRREWSPEMTVSSIARTAGVHPVYLARVMRWSYGTSVSALLRDSRLRWAAAAVIDGHRSLSDIAQAAGFADQAHLSRSFTSELGLPPRHLRLLRDVLGRVNHRRSTNGFADSRRKRAPGAY